MEVKENYFRNIINEIIIIRFYKVGLGFYLLIMEDIVLNRIEFYIVYLL